MENLIIFKSLEKLQQLLCIVKVKEDLILADFKNFHADPLTMYLRHTVL